MSVGKVAFDVQVHGGRHSYHDPILKQVHHYKPSAGLAFAPASNLGHLAKVETTNQIAEHGYLVVGGLEGSSELLAELALPLDQLAPAGPNQLAIGASKRIRTAQAILALDRADLLAAQALVDLFPSQLPFVAESAIRAASDTLRVEAEDELYIQTPAFELMRNELLNYLDCENVTLFVAAMPVLLFERPVSTLRRCSNLLESLKDPTMREAIAVSLDRNKNCCLQTRLLDNVRKHWLATESEFSLLLGHGRPPLLPTPKVESIVTDGLKHRSPTYRLVACTRCTFELDPSTALRLLRQARSDEPDTLVSEILDSAISFVEKMLS